MTTLQRLAKTKTDTSNVNMPAGMPFIPKQTNRKLIAWAWKTAGLAPKYPIDTRTVFALGTLCGYEANRKTLEYHLRRSYFPTPSKQTVDGCHQFAWTEANVINFLDSLERTRNWLPMHAIHKHKLTPKEFTKAHKIADARNEALQAFNAMTAPDLIHWLTVTDNGETRELLAMTLKAKLGLLDVKGDEAPNPENN